MHIFDFDIETARAAYADQGWVHIRNGMHPDFLAELRTSTSESLSAAKLDSYAIKGKKEQALYTFPPETNYPDELFDVVSDVCGLNRDTMTLSERHIQAYEANANPHPQAHKDRFPSQVSVGFSVSIPAQSRLVLYPLDRREVNPFNAAAALIRTLSPDELPDVALRDARPVELDDRDGDVVMFPGSSTWHLRSHAAGAVNLYVKLNDFDCDPLGEDPVTASRRDETLAQLRDGDGDDLDHMLVKLSRRFDTVQRTLVRDGWRDVLQASLYREDPFGITEVQLQLLQAAGDARPLSNLTAGVAANGLSEAQVRADALQLLRWGALDLLPSP